MAKRKVRGICGACGQEKQLSREHVPPQSAFNKETVIGYKLGDYLVEGKKVKVAQYQGGYNKLTLCKQCNNDTGTWYAGEYLKWAEIFDDVMVHTRSHKAEFAGVSEIALTLKDVYPLKFLKQVVTCFLSVNYLQSKKGQAVGMPFIKQNPELGKFVLDRHRKIFPDNYQFYLRLSQSREIRHMFDLAAKLSVTTGSGGLKAGPVVYFSEMTHPPMSLGMTTDGGDFPDMTNITHFKNYDYDECVDELIASFRAGKATSAIPGAFEPL